MTTLPKSNVKAPPPRPKGSPRTPVKAKDKEGGKKEKGPKPNEQSEEDREREGLREKAIVELIETETTYCGLLDKLCQHYVIPLRDYKLINEEQHKTLFPQLEVIKQLSETFLHG
ncbi:Rho guanine nucleotide exchange factor [Reticulomyxa filosa]|uniref:Rho guanine nucleotide exchange factor n=1 Tax=Reticulomyxa filosa TaxID=46433 RepID=X6MIH7_RETFI|nr:Rho guanine nucleotide exchange factor [Reticulomyxa filosa]|eukprot:ETO13684.1 Rho guanine nucleotide exchange factor [Reticulomyxa filosa]